MASKIKKKKINQRVIFYMCAVAWPIVQFFIFYVCVNFNSILLSVRKLNYYTQSWEFAGIENFESVLKDFSGQAYMMDAFKNTLTIFLISLVTMFIPIILAYYLFKKYPMHGMFKVFLFLPHIVSSMALVLCYKYFAEVAIPEIWKICFNKQISGLVYDYDTMWGTLLFYHIWVGMGGSFLLYLGAMSSISDSVLEAAQLDGVNPIQEFLFIVFPMVYPTFITFVVTSFATLFTNQLNVFTFFGDKADYSVYTMGYLLYAKVRKASISDYPYYSALGLILTAFAIPLCFGTKWLLTKIGPKTE